MILMTSLLILLHGSNLWHGNTLLFSRFIFLCTIWRNRKQNISYTWCFNKHVPTLRAHGGCDRSAEDAYSSAAPDPTFAIVGGPCCRTLDFVIAFWITIAFYTLLTSLFCIDNNKTRSSLYCTIYQHLLHIS
jgi:hypothetical protein